MKRREEKRRKKEEEKEKEKQRYGNHVWNIHMFGLCMESTYVWIMYGIDV